MAFSNSAIWEVQTGGSDALNGGCFDIGVTGFPTDGAATSANTSAPVFTSASYNFVAGDIGAWLFIKSGTNWTPGFYQIVSVTSNAATLSAAIGAAATLSSGMSTAVGCATVASPTAATWGVDYSQQATAQFSFTDMVIGATTTQFTSAANPVTKSMTGNSILVTSGTGFTVQRVVVSFTTGTTATCDKTLGTAASTGGTGKLGGALASPGLASSLANSLNTIYIKAGTYLVTSAASSGSGACLIPGNAGFVIGYSTNRVPTNTDTRPIIRLSVSSATLTGLSLYRNLSLDGNLQTAAKSCGNVAIFENCSFASFTTAPSGFIAKSCSFTGHTATAVQNGSAFSCVAYANTATPFVTTAQQIVPLVDCLSYGNTGASTDGFSCSSYAHLIGCVAYNNGRDGFRMSSPLATVTNCIAEGNAGFGFNPTAANSLLSSCAAYNNTSGATSSNGIFSNFKTITAGSVFTNAASGDFSLNNITNQGALLRGAGEPLLFPVGLSTASNDIGAVRHADPASVSLSRMFAGF